jgi:hypothetical protein
LSLVRSLAGFLKRQYVFDLGILVTGDQRMHGKGSGDVNQAQVS